MILSKLSEASYGQLDLFGEVIRLQRLSRLYESVDTLREKYGWPTRRPSMTASVGSCRSDSATSCPARRHANGWGFPCSWVRSTSGDTLEGSSHGRRACDPSIGDVGDA